MKSAAVTMLLFLVMLVTVTLQLVEQTAAEFDEDLHAMYQTMPINDFIEHFNKQNYSWKMGHHKNHIEGNHVACVSIDHKTFSSLPLLTHDVKAINLPENFDAREEWPQCESIKEIYNQGGCGSCWTFGAATSASDRTCIHKDIHVRLSEQDLDCLQDGVCNGGDPFLALHFWKSNGLVTRSCKPYNITELNQNKCIRKCKNRNMKYKEEKHFADQVYQIAADSDQIKTELVTNGPIQASFVVYEDFHKHYKSGVYVHKFGNKVGDHSVRVIGYGVEDARDYWLMANSWGTGWGEKGWAKMQSYQENIGFENYLSAGLLKN